VLALWVELVGMEQTARAVSIHKAVFVCEVS
jgi:hypothetical protein